MLGNLFPLVKFGIAAAKVNPGMLLTATRDIVMTIMDRNGNSHDITYANEGDVIRVEHPDDERGDDLFVCTNTSNYDEVGSIHSDNLDDVLMEYT